MTISYVGGDITGTGPPFVPVEDGSPGEGDFMLAYGFIGSIDGNWTVPADFTMIDEFSETVGAPDHQVFIAYKVRGADAGSGYSFAYDGTDSTAKVCLVAYTTDGSDDLALDVTYVKGSHYHGYTSSSDDFNAAAPAITTETNGAAVILAYMSGSSQLDGFGPPSGYNQHKAAGGTTNIYECSDIIATAGLETPGDFTHTEASPADQDQRTFTIAISEQSAASTSKLTVFRRIRG